MLKPLGVQCPWLDAQYIAQAVRGYDVFGAAMRDHPAAQAGHEVLHLAPSGRRWAVPDGVHELIAGGNPAGIDGQCRERDLLARPMQRDPRTTGPCLQRPQDPELQAALHGRGDLPSSDRREHRTRTVRGRNEDGRCQAAPTTAKRVRGDEGSEAWPHGECGSRCPGRRCWRALWAWSRATGRAATAPTGTSTTTTDRGSPLLPVDHAQVLSTDGHQNRANHAQLRMIAGGGEGREP